MAQPIADVIKYEGDNSTFIWKHPKEDFNSLTQLIVHESQEAIFFLNGEALDSFGPGRHTLETENIPRIGKLLQRTTGDQNPFHCEVYFINKTVQMSVKWGTPEKIRFVEPTLGVPLELGASGDMNLAVSNGRKLLLKLVGTTNGIAWEKEGAGFTKSLQLAFRPLISTAVKTHLSAAIKKQNMDVVDIDQHLEELSGVLKERIEPGFEEYGLRIPQFYLTTVILPESDPNFRRLRDLHTIGLQQRMAEAEAAVRTSQAQQKAAYMQAEAQAEAQIKAAQRQAVLEKETTETEVAKREAERQLIKAQTEAQAAQMEGLAEAAVMQAKGYNQKDVLQAEVQKAYAEGIGNMGPAIGGGGGSSVMGDMLGLGVGMAAMNAMAPQVGEMMKNFNVGGFVGAGMQNSAQGVATTDAQAEETIQCPTCGRTLPAKAKFCLECGTKIEQVAENEMICPVCGKKTPKGKFCMECGALLATKCPKCGAEVPAGGKFCLECGERV